MSEKIEIGKCAIKESRRVSDCILIGDDLQTDQDLHLLVDVKDVEIDGKKEHVIIDRIMTKDEYYLIKRVLLSVLTMLNVVSNEN